MVPAAECPSIESTNLTKREGTKRGFVPFSAAGIAKSALAASACRLDVLKGNTRHMDVDPFHREAAGVLQSHGHCLLDGLGEFGRLGRSLLLQGLALADGVLQLLLHFGHPLFVLAAGDLFSL